MMQVETEVEKQSGLVLREVTLTNLKVRSSKCFGPKHTLGCVRDSLYAVLSLIMHLLRRM